MRVRGVMESFNAQSGFGFIRLVSGKEAYVHRSAFQVVTDPVLRKGLEVECDVEPGPMGLRALNVRCSVALKDERPIRTAVAVPGSSKPPVREAASEVKSSEDRTSRASA